ncbi:hypothetical protein Bca52824_001915 [Brassica carinata]|uniref:Ubiquitin-like protease family profile domain-containing protein n=1 Tax=Brassica carinata TaxID=52824 RepID=A0A8X7WL32_BRACI|nr:hypothetical protein Bca52824_001915 [Brassica carinata]
MVSSRLVDFPEEETDASLPEMMFADGEEPVGIRVLTYQSSRALNTILNALDVEEIQFLRQSSFGKFVEISDKPAFSGRFARFLLSPWFRFAGNPIRFSLREFAIVTGLPCGQYPRKTKMKKKKNINDKPYWPELFGSVEDMRVSKAVKMLRRKTVTDRDIQMKLACLAIISLSQNTIALKGFALALQLVIVEACPSLTEVVQEVFSSSESDTDDDDVDCMARKTKKQALSPSHAREVDRKAEALVRCIIPQDPARPVDECSVVWSDEVNDIKVENMVMLISANQIFRKEMFRGGATKSDVERMRELVRAKGKKKPTTVKQQSSLPTMIDDHHLKSVVLAILKPEVDRLDGNVASALASMKEVSSSAIAVQSNVVASVETMLTAFRTEMLSFLDRDKMQKAGGEKQPPRTTEGGRNEAPPTYAHPLDKSAAHDDNDLVIDNVLENLSHYSTPPRSSHRQPQRITKTLTMKVTTQGSKPPSGSAQSQTHKPTEEVYPSFSLGLTQDEVTMKQTVDADMVPNSPAIVANYIDAEADQNEETILCRKSKRMRSVPTLLLSDYQCGTSILNRAREGQMLGSNSYESSLIREKYTRLKILLNEPCFINVAGLSVSGKDIKDIGERSRFLPSRGVVECLTKSFKFDGSASCFYLPFIVERKHWIGVCVDLTTLKLQVLDCNICVRSDSALAKDLLPISEMFPYLVKHCGFIPELPHKPLLIERIKGLPQNTNPADAGITASLLIQTHALFGVDSCRCITPSVLPDEAQRAAVMVYEFHQNP